MSRLSLFRTECLRAASLRGALIPALVLVLTFIAAFTFGRIVQAAPQATITVTTTDDIVKADGKCSLREAIQAANTNLAVNECPAGSTGVDLIQFGIGAGTPSIKIKGTLPTITSAMTINGKSGGATRVELNGVNAAVNANGLTIAAQKVTIRSMVINRFGGNGIEVSGLRANIIVGSFIGTDAAGTADLGNTGSGIHINSSTDNTIGGAAAADRNIISGNTGNGISLDNALDAAQLPNHNLISGNLIGTDVTGTTAIPNAYGISVYLGSGNVIGGTTGVTPGGACTGACNLVSGNSLGMYLNDAVSTRVQGNLIGTDVSGNADLGNTLDGIAIGGTNTTVGGTTASARNTISGNNRNGIYILGTNATDNLVQGNYIGTNSSGAAALGNGQDGINVRSTHNTVGGSSASARNLISGNGGDGIHLAAHSGNNNILGNFIGTPLSGVGALANGDNGIYVDGSRENTIGGTTGTTPGGNCTGACNLISGNTLFGIHMRNGFENLIQGNFIGPNVDGATVAANSNGEGGVFINIGRNNTFGGTTPNARNLISGNGGDGIRLGGTLVSETVVQGNFIGTTTSGANALANQGYGVLVRAEDNTIGGSSAGARNVISGNTKSGVAIQSEDGTGNNVLGNYIGTAANGTSPLGNGTYGVELDDDLPSANRIGGNFSTANPTDANVIAFNTQSGVHIVGGNQNAVRFNSIFSNGTPEIDLIFGNNDQAAPVLAVAVTGSTHIQGTLTSTPSTSFVLDFYSSPGCADPEGKTYVGSKGVSTNSGGNLNFTADLTATAPLGSFITATATDSSNNTSEFSNCAQVVPPSPTPTATNTPTVLPGSTNTPTATPTNDCVAKPSKPTLLIPGNNSTVTTGKVKLKWSASDCVTDYQAIIKDVATGQTVFKKVVTGRKTKTTNALPPGDYKAFVWARNNLGKTKSNTNQFSK